ncbi:hypothetical protein DBZ36_05240 [Alginatibacterium sediminis]|uniref:Carboxypeptidase regulatory-like domain-containing protein n=1 Tax=Alginatibacterium sediminis TaxID=2164068 RepID=A0A420EGS5_9ALTE|nr:hypothetical protein [Alginatibacterium sediminis]RKF19864.1 hypothetical protein DBZ36_05240 [Alginatibacterium sediminis]
MNAKLKLMCLIILGIVSLNLYALPSRSYSIQGGFCSAQNQAPVPGLLVSLVHPQLGRSEPSYTNQYGVFQLYDIPHNDKPYYIEVYWGTRLIYRNQLLVQGPLNLPMQCI